MLELIVPEASPGVPYAIHGLRNDTVISSLGSLLVDVVLDRVEKLLSLPIHYLKETDRVALVNQGCMDPVRLFVKNEPHLHKKIAEGRQRLIMSVSLVDKVIEMLLLRHLSKLEIRNWQTIPSKPGIGFDDTSNAVVAHDVFSEGDMAYSDMSGWDWSVKDWMLHNDAELNILLCKNPSEAWMHLLRCKAITDAKSLYQFSDGEMVAPTFEGILNSGKFLTSCTNSKMRVLVARLIGCTKCNAAGDDATEKFVENAIEKYAELGLTCKDYKRVVDEFEFCSRRYFRKLGVVSEDLTSMYGSHAINLEKITMQFLHCNLKDSMIYWGQCKQFENDLRDHPKLPETLELIRATGLYDRPWPEYLD
jgi:hypothetical protein